MATTPPRLARLQQSLEPARLDGAILFGADAICHLSGYWRYLGGAGAVVVPCHGLPTLVLSRDEQGLVPSDAPIADVVGYGRPGWAVERDPDRALALALGALTSRGHWGTAFGAAVPGVLVHLNIATVVTALALAARRVKDRDEIERIAAATKLARLGQEAVRAYLDRDRPTEIGALSHVHAVMQEAAGEVIAVVPDMIAGAHAAGAYAPIATPEARVVARGEALISDLLVRLHGYWGQCTRTHGRGVIADPEAASATDAVGAIARTAAESMRPGITAGALDASMRAQLEARLPGTACPHHTGHGLGLSFEDAPQIVADEPTALEAGMVLTLSPGAYRAGRFGVRVADVYVVGAEGGDPIVPDDS